jgi:AAA domain/UvrD-like helicase C-terminal domain
MIDPWNEDVRGEQVLPLINRDAAAIRVEAGPGTGKTYGLTRRVQRILHPKGLGVDGKKVLVVAFNRVIAKDLRGAIDNRLKESDHNGKPVIQTVHALCLQVIGNSIRLLLPHECEAMIFDVLAEHPQFRQQYEDSVGADQALRDHEAGHEDHAPLWQAVQSWLTRHKARLISELPSLVLDGRKGGDFRDTSYDHVIVDEFQDLTQTEQELVVQLLAPGGQFVALGDPRQSIYRFRGNEREGLSKLESLLPDVPVTDLPMNECQRCPSDIVEAANRLMSLSPAIAMKPTRTDLGNVHLVTWTTPTHEAEGMARAIVKNVQLFPKDKHLVMVTRKQFGYQLRTAIAAITSELSVDLSFSESLLQTWAVREAFLFFCLVVDPDPPTWRAWLGYQNSLTGKEYKADTRNADAYLRFLTTCSDCITETHIRALASEPQNKRRGDGGSNLWQRAKRFVDLKDGLSWDSADASSLLVEVFNPAMWIDTASEEEGLARTDFGLILDRSNALLLSKMQREGVHEQTPALALVDVAKQLRYLIATRGPIESTKASDLMVATLWGAKGVTADHVYVLGACAEALPGLRRKKYPGTDDEYRNEQQRLFYVTITRSRSTLVLSRANEIDSKDAMDLGLSTKKGYGSVKLNMCPFLRDIMPLLPDAQYGETWAGC